MSALQTIQTLRYASAITLSIIIAYWFQWALSYILPIFVSLFLTPPSKAISFRQGILLWFVILLAIMFGFFVGVLLSPYPYIMTLVVMLVLFLAYYANAGGASLMAVLWVMIGIILLPLLSFTSTELAWLVAKSLILAAAIGILIVWLMHQLLPDPVCLVNDHEAATPELDKDEQLYKAFYSTAVMMPLVLLFFLFNLNGALITLLFAAIIAMQTGIQSGKKTSAGLIIGCALGGVVSIIIYKLLIAVPTFPFMVALMFLTLLFLAREIYSKKPSAALFQLSITTFLIIIGNTTSASNIVDAGAGSFFYTRIMQIMFAGAYIVVAYYLIDYFMGKKQIKDTEPTVMGPDNA